MAGFAAHQGYLALSWVILTGAAGNFLWNQIFFYLGRRHGTELIGRHPSVGEHVIRARNLLDRFRTLLILLCRFMYGLRTVVPVIIGMSSISQVQFVLLNAIGALLWAILAGTGGYLFGSAFARVMGDIRRYELLVLAAMAVTCVLIWAVYIYRRRKRDGTIAGRCR